MSILVSTFIAIVATSCTMKIEAYWSAQEGWDGCKIRLSELLVFCPYVLHKNFINPGVFWVIEESILVVVIVVPLVNI